MNKTLSILCLGLLAVFLSAGQATTIVFENTNAYSSGHHSYAKDPVTGKFYSRDSYNGGNTVRVYNNQSDFENNIQAGSVALQGGSFYGTYFAVNNGSLFGRTTNHNSEVARWNLNTGVKEITRSIPNMGGSNGTHTFNWGGYSGVNWMQDSTGLYLMGKNSSGNDWQVNKMSTNLDILATKTFEGGSLGYAFMMNGKLFTADFYSSNSINKVFDWATGSYTSTNVQVTGGDNSYYFGNTLYDYQTDTLYMNDVTGSTDLAKISNASSTSNFNAPNTITPPPVPEPGSFLCLIMAMIGAWIIKRRTSQ